MNNKCYIISVIITLTLFSCTQTKEDIIKDEFKKYVKSNFDDPQDLKEIVSIEQIDTITYEHLRDGLYSLHKIVSLVDTLKKIGDGQNDEIIKKIKARNYASYNHSRVQNWIKQSLDLNINMYSWINTYYDQQCILRDSLNNMLEKMNDLNIFQYRIKARINDNGNLKLHEYYALEDSTNIRIFNKRPTFDDYSEETAVFYKVAREYEDIINMRQEMVHEKLEINKEILGILY